MRPNPFLQRLPRRKKPALKRALFFLALAIASAAVMAAFMAQAILAALAAAFI